MKRVMSLLAVVSVVLPLACGGAEGMDWKNAGAEPELLTQDPSFESSRVSATAVAIPLDAGTDAGTPDTCIEYPLPPTVPEPADFDTFNFTSSPLFNQTTTTRSMYLVAFRSPTSRFRMYVYGIDVVSRQFMFAGTLDKTLVRSLTTRTGIDLGNFQASGASNPKGGMAIEIEGPPPPPPTPGIHDPSVQNYGKFAWKVAVELDLATSKLAM